MTSPEPVTAAGAPATSGLAYADVPNRVIAYIIDAIIVGILSGIVGGIVGGTLGLQATRVDGLNVSYNYVAALILGILGVIISGAYFVYLWSTARATLGMRVLGLQIGNAGDGVTLTTEQAVRRYLVLAVPGILTQVFLPLPLIGALFALASLGWVIYLLYTTAKSPTKQGFHDVFANTQVVKAVKTVG